MSVSSLKFIKLTYVVPNQMYFCAFIASGYLSILMNPWPLQDSSVLDVGYFWSNHIARSSCALNLQSRHGLFQCHQCPLERWHTIIGIMFSWEKGNRRLPVLCWPTGFAFRKLHPQIHCFLLNHKKLQTDSEIRHILRLETREATFVEINTFKSANWGTLNNRH